MGITKNEDVEIKKRKIDWRKICWFCAPLFYFFIINLFFAWMNQSWAFLYIGIRAFLFQYLLVFLVQEIILGIVRKRRNAIIIMGGLLYILSVINLFKFAFTGDPVLFSDLLFVSNAGEVVGLVQGELGETLIKLFFPIIGEGVLFSVYIWWSMKVFRNSTVKSWKKGLGILLVSGTVFSLLVLPIKPIDQFVLTQMYKIDQRKDFNTFTSISMYYCKYGLVGGIYGQMLEDRIWKPENYSEEKIQKALSTVESNPDKKFGKPNIIVIFSESFWDIDQLDEVQFNQPVTSNFNRLKNEGMFFNMISPSFGGISANVEFEFLTGANLMYYNRGYIPYMQLYNDDSYYNRPTIIKELQNNGYKTKIVSCTSPKLFDCAKVYDYFGVDETQYIPENLHRKGLYVSDEYVMDQIIDNFNHKKKDERLFYMTLTMQAHMPYPINKYQNYDVRVTKSNLPEEMNDILTSYAQGIYDADQQLGRISEYIKTLEEPTIVVFYGDHLPYWKNGRESVMDRLKFFHTEDETLNQFRKYNTQALILSNFKMETQAGDSKYLGPDLLSAYILNNMDIELSNYYKWLYNSRDTVGAANFAVATDGNGKLYRTNELNGKMKEIYEMRKQIEYKLFVE